MELDPKDVLVFQVKRDFVNLYKSFLVILEDLEKENEISFNKLKRQFPEAANALECANFFDEAKMEYLRKKILDLGNGSIRHVTTELEKYNVDFNIETKV